MEQVLDSCEMTKGRLVIAVENAQARRMFRIIPQDPFGHDLRLRSSLPSRSVSKRKTFA